MEAKRGADRDGGHKVEPRKKEVSQLNFNHPAPPFCHSTPHLPLNMRRVRASQPSASPLPTLHLPEPNSTLVDSLANQTRQAGPKSLLHIKANLASATHAYTLDFPAIEHVTPTDSVHASTSILRIPFQPAISE